LDVLQRHPEIRFDADNGPGRMRSKSEARGCRGGTIGDCRGLLVARLTSPGLAS
jgi:hypothetical protein